MILHRLIKNNARRDLETATAFSHLGPGTLHPTLVGLITNQAGCFDFSDEEEPAVFSRANGSPHLLPSNHDRDRTQKTVPAFYLTQLPLLIT